MNTTVKRIKDLIRTDLITMSGGKNSQKTMVLACVIAFGALGMVVSPLAGLYIPLLMGGFFVPMLFGNEMKYHSEKMFALLPVRRKDIVRSRFILSVGAYLIAAALFYLLMLLSIKLKLFLRFIDDEKFDILSMLAERSGSTMSETGYFNMLYFAVSFWGLTLTTSALRKYFRNSSIFDTTIIIRKAGKQDYKMLIIAMLVIIGLVVFITDLLPVRAALAPVGAVIAMLFEAANGLLMGALLLVMGIMSAIYRYICTMLEYEEREL